MSEYKTLNAKAYETLREMILDCRLEFRQVYSETKLAARLEISRTPVRDALNRLSQERYIDVLPNRGFTLHIPTQGDILEAYHVRMMMETYCAGIVARDYPGPKARAAVGRMEDDLFRQHRLMEEDGAYDLNRFWLDDLDFHRALLEYMGISSLMMQYERIMYTFMPHHLIREKAGCRNQLVRQRHLSSVGEHAAITEALKSRDPDQARRAVSTHLDSSLRASFQRMEGQEGKGEA